MNNKLNLSNISKIINHKLYGDYTTKHHVLDRRFSLKSIE